MAYELIRNDMDIMEHENRQISNSVSKRIQVTVPDRLADDLEHWADHDGRPVSNLCAFLLEQAVKAAKANGEFPPGNPITPTGGSQGG